MGQPYFSSIGTPCWHFLGLAIPGLLFCKLLGDVAHAPACVHQLIQLAHVRLVATVETIAQRDDGTVDDLRSVAPSFIREIHDDLACVSPGNTSLRGRPTLRVTLERRRDLTISSLGTFGFHIHSAESCNERIGLVVFATCG